jgi:cold-inducible RNA-binding protein
VGAFWPSFLLYQSSGLVLEQSDRDDPYYEKENSPMTNIFVGNLSFKTTQEDLLATFSQYGTVERVNIITDRETGQPRGFAFIEMPDRREAETAITQLNGADLNGRTLNVNEARPKPQGGGGGGAKFGNRGGGRGGYDRNRGGGGGGRW